MNTYRYIPLSDKNLRYLPAIKKSKGIWVYIPIVSPDPEDTDLDQEPIVSEDV